MGVKTNVKKANGHDVDLYKKFGVCTSHTGKMCGNCSFSSNASCNPYCLMMSKNPNTPCAHCYAQSMEKQYINLSEKITGSTATYTERLYEDWELPLIVNPNGIGRVESFGELQNIQDGGLIQARNYIRMVKKNSHLNWAWFSKRPEIIDMAMKLENADINCNFVYSNPFIDSMSNGVLISVENILERYPWINAVFTVYTAEYAYKNHIAISCGKSKCISCLNCYNCIEGVKFIGEVIKSEQSAYYNLIQYGTKKKPNTKKSSKKSK